ncbi:MAG TPA: PfkB family carbohydrate kinase [Terriglobia bacterium]|nr:PfkB family carbohydrate kinase [Terriglobia bacterium]
MEINASDRSSLLSIIRRFPRQKIVLLGDLVADEFIGGEIARVSREAPVLILKQRSRKIVPGGGANAVNNLAELGARVTPVGVVGDDEAGGALLGCFREKQIPVRRIVRLQGHVTPTKCRVLGVISHGRPQQIVRVDREPPRPLDRTVRRRLSALARAVLQTSSALLVSDYGYGATGAREVEGLARLARRGRHTTPVTVDSRYGLLTYHGVTAATPNEPEIEAAFGVEIGNDLDTLHRLARRMLRRQSLDAVLVTRGRAGMAVFEAGKPPRHLSIFGSDQVADVTGAGDTVIAAFTLALAAGAGFVHAAMLANCAGGLVVMKSGTATVTRTELEEAIRNA